MDVEPFPSYRSESEIEKPADLSRWSAGALNTNQRAFNTRVGFYTFLFSLCAAINLSASACSRLSRLTLDGSLFRTLRASGEHVELV